MEHNLYSLWQVGRYMLLFGLVLYLILAIYMAMFQSRFVYYPTYEIERNPRDIYIEYEYIDFKSTDGTALTGWFIPAPEQKGVILFCHGNGGNISHRLDTISILNKLGLSTFIFDYRGYGQSDGKPSEKGTYNDAEAAWLYLTEERGIPAETIIIHGRSLGGPIAAWLSTKHTPKVCILESTFTSVPDLGSDFYPWLPVRLMSRFHYSTISYIKEITCPILIIHSSEDDLIPYSHGQALFEAAGEPKEFLHIHGSHNDGYVISRERYSAGLKAFLDRYMTQQQ